MSLKRFVELALEEGFSCTEVAEILVKTEQELCQIKLRHPECWDPEVGWLCPVCTKDPDQCPLHNPEVL